MENISNLDVGINIIGHDSSITYIDIEKEIIFAIDEERISRFKHEATSIQKGLSELLSYLNNKGKRKINLHFCYENEPDFGNSLYLLSRIISPVLRTEMNLTEVKEQDKYLTPIMNKLKTYFILKTINTPFKQSVKEYIKNDFDGSLNNIEHELYYNDHHSCHCIGAYYLSPFDECLSLSIDFAGDRYFSKVFLCEKDNIKEIVGSKLIISEENEIVSIGRIYSHITWFLGYLPNSDEGKVEALAAYGKKENRLYDKLMCATTINDNNEIIIDEDLFIYFRNELNDIKEEIGDKNIAAAVQGWLEDFMVKYVDHIISSYKIKNLVLSGGVANNVKLNMNIFERSNIDQLYLFPAMSDSGAGFGALINGLRKKGKINYRSFKSNNFVMPYWGNEYKKDEILSDIKLFDGNILVDDIGEEWEEVVADYVTAGKICGIFQGRMEYGPRALGNRSILGDARNEKTKDILNSVIKGRPSFQPFCPSILEEDREMLFSKSYSNKHMTCAFRMKKKYVNILPSAVHIDGTARPQFVENSDNPSYYKILKAIKKITGYGIVVNTSFNKHGLTIVNRPSDAIKDFLDSDMDYVFFENLLVSKK